MKSRVFNICQYENNPETGESLNFSEENIRAGLTHKSIKEWAYICHDKDVYTEEDEINTGYKKAGELKPRHWHIVLKSNYSIELNVIARWFNVPENMIDVPKGYGAFLDCVEYLTHERCSEEKHRYEDSEVKASFDFREALDEKAMNRLKYGKDLSKEDAMLYEVRYNGMTLKEARKKDRIIYMKNEDKLHKARMNYIADLDPPSTRVNYYVCGGGGEGKGLACRALARSLYQGWEDDYDIFFEVGAKGAAFEGYDGQPVIIWNDRRAVDLLEELDGRGNVFNVFDTHPSKQRQNIKYSSVNLCNTVNIVNSVQPYKDFLDGLAGEYKDKNGKLHKAEDKKQSYRRFWFIMPIDYDAFEVMVNCGVFEGNDKATDFEEFLRIKYSFSRMRQLAGKNKELIVNVESKVLEPVKAKHEEILESEARSESVETFNKELAKCGIEVTTDGEGELRFDGQLKNESKNERFF